LDLPAVTSVLRRAIRHNKVLELANPGHAEHGAVLAAIQAAYAPHGGGLAASLDGRCARRSRRSGRDGETAASTNRETMLINPSK
jgi:hypothetical protein